MTPDDRELAMIPAATALVAAVRSRDAEEIRRVLASHIDYPALVVILADMANEAPAHAWIKAVLGEIAAGELTHEQIGNRYGLSAFRVAAIARDNGHRDDDPGDTLTAGRWVHRRGIARWEAAS